MIPHYGTPAKVSRRHLRFDERIVPFSIEDVGSRVLHATARSFREGVVDAKTTLPYPKTPILVLTYCLHIAALQAV